MRVLDAKAQELRKGDQVRASTGVFAGKVVGFDGKFHGGVSVVWALVDGFVPVEHRVEADPGTPDTYRCNDLIRTKESPNRKEATSSVAPERSSR
jgi:hypothetical protein